VGFPGLAYCLGGRSLYWGGWSPRLTDADLANWPPEIVRFLKGPRAQWPSDLAAFLAPLPPAPLADFSDGYEAVEKETGVFDKTDYISGPLNAELTKQFTAVFKSVPTLDATERPLWPFKLLLPRQACSVSINTVVRLFWLTPFEKRRATPTGDAGSFWCHELTS